MRYRRAFTLVELAVVGVVALALMGFLAYSYLGVEEHVSADHSEAALRQVGSSLRGYYQTRGYFPQDSATLQQIEPGIVFSDNANTAQGAVVVAVGVYEAQDAVGLATLDASGGCVLLRASPITSTIQVAVSHRPLSAGACDGVEALALP